MKRLFDTNQDMTEALENKFVITILLPQAVCISKYALGLEKQFLYFK